ncbi:MAG: nucleotidyltransferase family protein [Candidatus Eremiobacterota bacterium]
MKAVVLAGGLNDRPLYPGYRPGPKALVKVGGRPMLERVLEALHPLAEVGLVGEADRLAPIAGNRRCDPGGEGLLASLQAALEMFPDQEHVLLCTADLPLLRPQMVEQFLALCRARPGGDLYLAMVPREYFRPPLDASRKSFIRFSDASVCHGNLALIRPSVRHNRVAMGIVDAIYESRKSGLRTALALGLRTSLLYALGVRLWHRISLDAYAAHLSRRFALRLVPVLSAYPEVTLDVDERWDYELVERVLGA